MSANTEEKMEQPRLMNVKELSSYLSMPTATVYAYVGRGKIPADCIKRIGRSLKFDRQAVDQWISGPAVAQSSVPEHTRSAH